MGIKPAIAPISNIEEVSKAPKIYEAALLCIFLSSLREYASGTLLKCQRGNL